MIAVTASQLRPWRGQVPTPPETDVAKIRNYCRDRVPARMRHQVRVEAAVRGYSVTIFDCRPPWHPNFIEWSRVRVAQLRYSPGRFGHRPGPGTQAVRRPSHQIVSVKCRTPARARRSRMAVATVRQPEHMRGLDLEFPVACLDATGRGCNVLAAHLEQGMARSDRGG